MTNFTLEVTDAYGAFGEDEITFSVIAEENAAPMAHAGDDQTNEVVHDGIPSDGTVDVTLDCGASTDDCPVDQNGEDIFPDLTYSWTGEDGAEFSGCFGSSIA